MFKRLRTCVLVAAVLAAGFLEAEARRARDTEVVTAAKKSTKRQSKLAIVRRDLHSNLDGKGDGFIIGWSFDAKTFTLTVDKNRYRQHMVYAATITARSIFDLNGVALPTTLVIRDRSGEILGSGPFTNVPRVVD